MSLKAWLPPELLRIARHVLGYGGHFRGHFTSWGDAAKHAQGYDGDAILEQVRRATLAVRDGYAASERDGVTFDVTQPPYPLIATLLKAASGSKTLRVIDFGGALGSSYFQCRDWLDACTLDWCVIEQAHFVRTGREVLAEKGLRFANNLGEAQSAGADVVLFSSVLQYIEQYADILAETIAARPRFIVIDRTPVIAGEQDMIRVQKQAGYGLVPSSYPIRLFAEATLMQVARQGYRLLSRFDAVDGPMGGLGSKVTFHGFIFEREDA